MRIRTVKPEFWTDATMVQFDPLVRLLFIGMWNVADDHGYLLAEPERLAMQVLPRETPEAVASMLDLLIAAGRVERFQVTTGDFTVDYLRIANWEKHQRVDKPSVSRICREGSRKVAIPLEVRRQVAAKYGCLPGEEHPAECFHCGSPGSIKWWKTSTGKVSGWVSFSGLQLDHFEAESKGGATICENIVLACEACNKSKGNRPPLSKGLANIREDSGRTREDSREEGKGREVEGKGKEMLEKPVAKKPATPSDPRLRPLGLSLEAIYESERGERYKHGGAKDTEGLKALLSIASDEKIRDRWRHALRRTEYPKISSFAQLASKWTDLAAPTSQTKGSVINGQTAWTDADDFATALAGGNP